MHPIQRQRAQLINRHARIGDLQRGRVEAAAATGLALARFHIGQGALAQRIRLGLRQRLIEVAGHRAPRALIIALNLIFSAQGLDRDYGALFREEDPVAVLLRQVLPRRIQVIAQVHQNVVEVLAGPGTGPCLDGAFLDGEGGIWDHGVLSRLVDHARAVALRAHTLRGIGREGIRVQALRVIPGARVEQAHAIGECGDCADRGTRTAAGGRLLQCDRRRQTLYLANLWVDGRANEAASEGRY